MSYDTNDDRLRHHLGYIVRIRAIYFNFICERSGVTNWRAVYAFAARGPQQVRK